LLPAACHQCHSCRDGGVMTDRTTIDRVAQEMQAEAFCIGMVKESWRNLSPESQDGWRMIATAGILALRDTVGPTVIDRILEPEKEGGAQQ